MGRDIYLKYELKSIEPSNKSLSELLNALRYTAFQGRAFGDVYRIIKEMINTPGNTIFMGLAGSMSTAGMWKLIKYFIEKRYIDVLVSTGANISEDIYEAMGFKYYLGSQYVDDAELLKYKIDRFYDVYADEIEYRKMEYLIRDFIKTLKPGSIYSSMEFLYLFGKYLAEIGIDCIVSTAYRKGVPVFSPALTDSAYGIASILARREGYSIVIDMVRDFDQLVEIGNRFDKLSAIYIGGGVPKDYINLVTVAQTLLAESKGIRDYYKGFEYAVQITTDSPQWGGLSGATLEEAVSWGKVSPNAIKRTVYVDATIALPIIIHGLIEEKIERSDPRDLTWLFQKIDRR
ncbi:MAG: deoxyhypusine synthase [Desulfurococcaceae archaeon]